MTRETQRKTILGFTIPEIISFGVLAAMVIGGLDYPKVQAKEQVSIHDNSAIAHMTLRTDISDIEKRVSDIEYWMTVSHKQEVDRAIKEITDDIKAELHKR